MAGQFISWYLIIQLIALSALPLTFMLFRNLPDRGYTFAKILGVFLVGLILWLGTSYGLLRNERGGAWLSLFLVAMISVFVSAQKLTSLLSVQLTGRRASKDESQLTASEGHSYWPVSWRYVVGVELFFLIAFLLLALVRAHDPAADHTEQPMDLMFMNGIWTSPTYPPQDPWLAGYAISYYYFGYWLLITLAHLAGQPPEIAYNLGQASWFGFLLLGAFGLGYNLLAAASQAETDKSRLSVSALVGGYLTAIAVGVIGNLQVVFEWLHANGYNIAGLANWFQVHNFPEGANVTNKWYIDLGWWWWRSSRVIEDLDFAGNHIEVIDEFPMFSYVLGDNHPHVLAMPIVMMVIALAYNLFLHWRPESTERRKGDIDRESASGDWYPYRLNLTLIPLGVGGLLVLIAGVGGLIFLNTWDFPPYWLLLVFCLFVVAYWENKQAQNQRFDSSKRSNQVDESSLRSNAAFWSALIRASTFGAALIVGMVLLYLPYFLTAQSQAGGFLPNLFYPTRFPQFLLMFGSFLPALCALIGLAWHPNLLPRLLISLVVVLGFPIAWLLGSASLVFRSDFAQVLLQRAPLPPDVSSYGAMMAQRWTSQSLTFITVGVLLSFIVALLWHRVATIAVTEQTRAERSMLFALTLAAIGLLLVYAPEFVYLRDNFGTRMNTVFKFYYQAWLLLGVSAAYAIVMALRLLRNLMIDGTLPSDVATANRGKSLPVHTHLATILLSILSLILMAGGLLYPIAGTYSKTAGFGHPEPTFDAIAHIGLHSPDERAAIAWVRNNTMPDALVLEAKGASYRSNYNRISTSTGRPTLLGWDGHESQWRGRAYGEMAQARPEMLEMIYRSGTTQDIERVLNEWEIDYVYLGPTERADYQIDPGAEERLRRTMDLAFESGTVRIYARRSQ
ncbi:hypothetical protein KFU94_15010 [Chloroflexi bacterium TSY]|nr:hypothetical protein [Chloroflexi bacterium TSY]